LAADGGIAVVVGARVTIIAIHWHESAPAVRSATVGSTGTVVIAYDIHMKATRFRVTGIFRAEGAVVAVHRHKGAPAVRRAAVNGARAAVVAHDDLVNAALFGGTGIFRAEAAVVAVRGLPGTGSLDAHIVKGALVTIVAQLPVRARFRSTQSRVGLALPDDTVVHVVVFANHKRIRHGFTLPVDAPDDAIAKVAIIVFKTVEI